MFEKLDGIEEIIKKYQEIYKLRLGSKKFIPVDFDKEIAETIFAEQKKEFKRLSALIEGIDREEQKKALFFDTQLKRNRRRLRRVANLLRKVELSSLVQKLVEFEGKEEPPASAAPTATGPTDTQGDLLDSSPLGQNSNE